MTQDAAAADDMSITQEKVLSEYINPVNNDEQAALNCCSPDGLTLSLVTY